MKTNQALPTVTTYKGFYIVQRKRQQGVDLVNPNGSFKVVKSAHAAKWRITHAVTIVRRLGLV
jgi:hypothetical protein